MTTTTYKTITAAKQAVIAKAKEEIGYLEKASMNTLDSKTANAGSGNYTKYWRDVYPSFQGQPWCAAFVSYLFLVCFGKDLATQMLKHWPFTYCPTLANMTENKDPKVGSIVLFYRNGVYAHTGLVIAVNSSKVVTIEGNTSGASGIVANGGGVCRKSYYRTQLSCMTKFFMPNYKLAVSASEGTSAASQKQTATTPKTTTTSSSGTLNETPKWTGVCTASALNVRKWAGMEYSRINSRPYITRGEEVGVCDTVYANNGDPWYFVLIDGQWLGFVHSSYIAKA